MLPFCDAVDAPNEDRVNVCDSDPPPTAMKTVDMPLSLSKTPHWSILSEVIIIIIIIFILRFFTKNHVNY